MAAKGAYPVPPIVDAVVELRFGERLSESQFDRAATILSAMYDQVESRSDITFELSIENADRFATVKENNPIRIFSNRDQTDLLRLDTDKLLWSRLPPYEGWESFQYRLFRDLHELPKKTRSTPLHRIGVRFQNRIDVPGDDDFIVRYENYLSINLTAPPILDPNMSYEWKLTKYFPDRKAGANVSSLTVPSEIPNTTGIMLDIDVYTFEDLPRSVDSLKKRLDDLRHLKNEIFEACITDMARDTFA